MNKCCLNFIGTFCTEDGTTVVGFVQMVDGVPTFLYFNLSDGEIYTGVVYTDACNGGSAPLYGVEVEGVAGTDITMPANTGTAFTIGIDNVEHTTGWTQTLSVVSFTDGTILAGGEVIKITYTKP